MSNPYKDGGNPFQGDNKTNAAGGAWYDPPTSHDDSPSYTLPTHSSPGVDQQPQWGAAPQMNNNNNFADVQQPQYANNVQQQPQWVDPQQARIPAGQPPDLVTAKFWTLEFYQQFFDVDTQDVLKRMGNVLLPFVPPDFLHDRHWHMGNLPGGVMPNAISSAAAAFSSGTEKRADLYGPLWISTTVWVTLAIVGNIMGKMAHDRRAAQRQADIDMLVSHAPSLAPGGTYAPGSFYTPEPLGRWTYDFSKATIAAGVVYTFIIFMSFLVWGLMKWKSVPVGLVDALCLYGYSMFVWMLSGILCAVPVSGFQWVVCFLGTVWSCGYLLLNMWQLWKVSLDKPWFIGLVLLVIGTQVALTIGFKLYFFDYDY